MDNNPTPPQQPPVLPPEQQPGMQISPPPASNKRRRTLLIALIVILAIGLIGLFVVIVGNFTSDPDDPQTGKKTSGSTYASLYKPVSGVTVNGQHYINPCQALPMQTAVQIYGNFGETGSASEDFLETSIKTDENTPYRSHCLYRFNNAQYSQILISAEQYASTQEVKKEFSYSLNNPDKIDKSIADLKAAVGNSSNKDAQGMVALLESSAADYRKVYGQVSEATLDAVNVSGKVLPNIGSNNYDLYLDNVVFNLSTTAVKNGKLSAADHLANLKQAVDTITKNAKNSKLSQNPNPTFLSDVRAVGNTKIYEPCNILSAANFKKITGLDQNFTVSRSTISANPDRVTYSKVDKHDTFAANRCTRTHLEGTEFDSLRTEVELSIGYPKTVEQAKAWMAAEGKTMTPIKSNADETLRSTTPSPTYNTVSYFARKGTHTISVQFTTTDSRGDDPIYANATEQQHIALINLMLEEMSKQ